MHFTDVGLYRGFYARSISFKKFKKLKEFEKGFCFLKIGVSPTVDNLS